MISLRRGGRAVQRQSGCGTPGAVYWIDKLAMSVSRRFRFAWYAHHLLAELVLIYPVAAIMMGERGVAPFDLSLLFALWSLAVVAAEVPTGVLADRVSRRRLLIVSRLVKGCCFLTWLACPGFWGYLAGFVCWGVASSLRSGTAESVLHDTLSAAGASSEFEQVYGRAVAAGHVGLIASFLAGGFLAGRVGFGIPLALSVAGPWLAAGVIAMGVADPPRGAPPGGDETYLQTLRAGLREARSSVRLLHIIGMTASIACIWEVFEEYLPVYLEEKGAFTLGAIGLTFACASSATIVAAAAAHRLPLRSLRAISLAFGLAGALLLASIPRGRGSRGGPARGLRGRQWRGRRPAGWPTPTLDSGPRARYRHLRRRDGPGAGRDAALRGSRRRRLDEGLGRRGRRTGRTGARALHRLRGGAEALKEADARSEKEAGADRERRKPGRGWR